MTTQVFGAYLFGILTGIFMLGLTFVAVSEVQGIRWQPVYHVDR